MTIYTLNLVISFSFSYILKPSGTVVLNLNLSPYCHVSLPCITRSDIKINYQSIQTARLHACTHHVVVIVINVIVAMLTLWYFIVSHATTIFFLSCIYVNTTKLLHIMCTLVVTSVILQSLECNEHENLHLNNANKFQTSFVNLRDKWLCVGFEFANVDEHISVIYFNWTPIFEW